MKKKDAKNNSGLSRRLHFPEDEKRLPWLPMLLDGYAIVDTGVAVAIRNEEKKRNSKIACGKDCGNCCTHQKDLPLYPHELVGIYWFSSEKVTEPGRGLLRNRLSAHTPGSGCPFLIDQSCSIHPVRPFGCRQFNVFTKACSPGEDPYYTRRNDVLEPIPEYIDRAFATVLLFYNIKREEDVSHSIRIVRRQIMNLQLFDWTKLVALMDQVRSSDPNLSK